jgi:tetratricopeptide (TPR) repeat protein
LSELCWSNCFYQSRVSARKSQLEVELYLLVRLCSTPLKGTNMHTVTCKRDVCFRVTNFEEIGLIGLLAAQILVGQQIGTEVPIVWPKSQQTQSNFVTIQQLRHVVPGKAQKEMQKADKARLAGRNEDAISRYKAAISIDPEYVAARNNLAAIYLINDNLQLGSEQLEEAIKIDPHNPTLFRNLSICYELARQLAAAERAARQAIDLDRSDLPSRMILGLVLVEQGKFTQEAQRCFERGCHQFPVAHLLAGRVLVGQGEVEKGQAEIQEYLATGDQDNRNLALKWLESLGHSDVKMAMASAH